MSIQLIETHAGARLEAIIRSVQPASQSALCAEADAASHVLSRVLQIRYKLFVEKVVYHGKWEWRERAERACTDSRALDSHLQIPALLGHDLRWHAVLLTSGAEPQRKEAENLLAASREKFDCGSLGAAYVARDRGVVSWQTDRRALARHFLLEAVDGLASFADARALGPAYCVLSKIILQGGGDRREARRYALAGAVLNPYGFVLGNAKEHLQSVSRRGLQRDIDDLLAGIKPFDVLSPVMTRLTDGSPKNMAETIGHNLARVLGSGSYFSSPRSIIPRLPVS